MRTGWLGHGDVKKKTILIGIPKNSVKALSAVVCKVCKKD
jgi:hypothetical protein